MGQVAKTKFEISQIILLIKRVRWQNKGFKINFIKFQLFRKYFKNSLPPWFYEKHFYFKNH